MSATSFAVGSVGTCGVYSGSVDPQANGAVSTALG